VATVNPVTEPPGIGRWAATASPEIPAVQLRVRTLQDVEAVRNWRNVLAGLGCLTDACVRALVEVGDPEAIDVFLQREDAFAALEEVSG